MSCSLTERAVSGNRASSTGTAAVAAPVAAACRLRGSNASSVAVPSPGAGQVSHQSASQGVVASLRAKPCCLCYWCCCCSCSCLGSTPGKGNGENGPTRSVNNVDLCDGEPLPSLDEIRSWGKSFDKLMKSPAGRKVFRDFLKCEYSEENILFWLACEDLKRENSPEVVEEMARIIYEDYISILSPKEVSLDSRVREIVNRNMVDPTPHTFDEAQLQIYTLMHRDSYPRFINSQLFKSLAQLQNSDKEDSLEKTNTEKDTIALPSEMNEVEEDNDKKVLPTSTIPIQDQVETK